MIASRNTYPQAARVYREVRRLVPGLPVARAHLASMRVLLGQADEYRPDVLLAMRRLNISANDPLDYDDLPAPGGGGGDDPDRGPYADEVA